MLGRAEGIRFVVIVRPVRAVTVIPGQQVSVALMDMPEPPDDDGPVLVQTQAVGICGTDLEIINSRPLLNQRHRLASLVTAQSATKMIKITAANRPKRS